MHGAGTAGGDAAAEFRTGHSQCVTQHPEQRRVGVDVDGVVDAFDFDRSRGGPLIDRQMRCLELFCAPEEGCRVTVIGSRRLSFALLLP
jgi:hypothetical protein